MIRTRRDNWIAAGLEALRSEGSSALTIDRLAITLGRTKGSFYHHFPDLDSFHSAVLAWWREHMTTGIIRETEAEPSVPRRRARLSALVSQLDVKLELAVRAWGLTDDRARQAVAEVDQLRMAHLENLWKGEGHARGARLLARLEYAAFLGAQQMYPSLSSHSARTLEAALIRALSALATD
ncbi:MAG: TetR/AcrR family transcriptional regulator [Deltaproteobacteria bacterium]|nr:TetR/AcrR family transcriptional regulator [Deltaproteobacteria bacterium]